jgi:NAD(P)-dependent dehydrogenase (short-subunit alcohol dehydrogenase family)
MTPSPVAIVTGAAGGIGRAIAARLQRDGHVVVGADLAAAGYDHDIAVDIADSASVNAMVAETVEKFGRIDVLVNAAGIHMQKLVIETSDADWDRIQAVNARGPFFACRAVAPHMMRAERGRIVNIVTRLNFGNPYSSAYMASKNALWGFTQCLAMELAAYHVTVNAVAPGHVGPGTGMEAAFRTKAEKLGMPWEAFEAQVLRTIPVGRWCRPEDVAAAVAYVVSPDAAFVTAECINVTGGFVGYGTTPPKVAI